MGIATFLSSSYQQYKEDTKAFTTWLGQAARSCGYKSNTVAEVKVPNTGVPAISSQRLKGKARKLAKKSGTAKATEPGRPSAGIERYKITTGELLEQARVVAQATQKGINLPKGIQSVLERAISARQRCATWFSQSGGDVTANERHQHFIDTLRNALDLLRKPATDVAPNSSVIDAAKSLSNRFEALELADLDDEYPITALDIATPSAQPKGAVPQGVFELEDLTSEFESTFDLFCFFEDVHAIHDEILHTWKRLSKGETTLNTATVVTQAGFDMVRRLEKEILARTHSCDHHTSKHPHITLCLPPFYMDAMLNGEDPDEILNSPKSLEHRPFYDFIYLPTARTLMKFADITFKAGKVGSWPLPVIPMRFSYISRPELLKEPLYQQQEKDDELLTQLLHDVYLIDEYRPMVENFADGGRTFPPMNDEFTKCSRSLWQSGKVHTHAVFACRVVLDILEICKSNGNPVFHRMLTEFNERANGTMGFFVDRTGALDTREVRWLGKDQALIMDIYDLTNLHIPNKAIPYLKNMLVESSQATQGRFAGGEIHDLPPELQAEIRQRMIERGQDPDEGPTEEHRRNAEKLDLKPIKPSQQQDFLQTHNPIHSGALSLRLTVAMEEAGIALANHHMSVFATAHLYNAFRQLNITTVEWPEMDRIIDLHKGAIFANDVPTTPSEMYRRICYRTGLSTSSKRFDQKKPWKMHVGAASAALKSLLDSKTTAEHALMMLEDQIEDHATQKAAIETRRKAAPVGRRRQLTPTQMLRRIEEYLPVVTRDLDIDYITLTKTCNALLREVRTKQYSLFGLNIPVVAEAGDSNDHGVVYLVLALLSFCEKAHNAHRKRKDGTSFNGGEHMQAARREFETFFNAKIAPIALARELRIEAEEDETLHR